MKKTLIFPKAMFLGCLLTIGAFFLMPDSNKVNASIQPVKYPGLIFCYITGTTIHASNGTECTSGEGSCIPNECPEGTEPIE